MALTPRQVAAQIGVRWHGRAETSRWLQALMIAAPRVTLKAMGIAAGIWHGMAVKTAPIRFTRKKDGAPVLRRGRVLYPPFYNEGPRGGAGGGRGTLRTTMEPFSFMRGGRIIGGVLAKMPYAAYVEFGTQTIAGGAVLRWRPGQAPVRDWLWRIEPRSGSTMPFIRPHIPAVLDILTENVIGGILAVSRRSHPEAA